MIFDSSTVNRLRRLKLVTRQVKAGIIRGERRSTRHGHSIEFADYRDYVPGDDLRQLDWNIYARHNHPFIKLRESEEDLAVYLLLDGSRSMDWGAEDENKFRYACRLAAGFAVVSLFSGDRFFLEALGTRTQLGPLRGQGRLKSVLDYLDGIEPAGAMDLYEECRQFTTNTKKAGLVILLSDLLLVDGYEGGLKHLQDHGHEVVLLHTLNPEELHPSLNGELQLIDSETGKPQEVNIDASMRRVYAQRLNSWFGNIRDFCNRRHIRYYQVDTSFAWDRFLTYEMRKAGLVQ